MASSHDPLLAIGEADGSDHTLEDLAAVECPVLLTKETQTGKVERRVVDLLALHLPKARVVEFDGSHAHHIESIDRFLESREQHLRCQPCRLTCVNHALKPV